MGVSSFLGHPVGHIGQSGYQSALALVMMDMKVMVMKVMMISGYQTYKSIKTLSFLLTL